MTPHNPFAPPAADLNLPPDADAPIRKPRSVWVMQIVSGVIAAWCGAGLWKLATLALAGETVTNFGVSIALQLSLQSGFVLMLLLMLWQLPKRSLIGRNIGLGLIALVILSLAVRLLNTQARAWPEAIGVAIAGFIFIGPLVYWAFAFAFSEKARRYFSAARNA